jgi:phosphoglycolate phosphatase
VNGGIERRGFSLLIFDWDGTLMDSIERIVASMEAAAIDVDLAPLARNDILNVIGLGLPEAIATLLPRADAATRTRFTDRYRHYFVEASPVPAPLFPGAAAALENLRSQGYLLAVATGKARRGLDRALADTGCTDFFHASRCADEVKSKPHPQMLLEIMAQLAVPAHATLMIGDTDYDMKMAVDAGVPALAVSYGVHPATRLQRHRPLACLDAITELVPWLASYRAVDKPAVTLTI